MNTSSSHQRHICPPEKTISRQAKPTIVRKRFPILKNKSSIKFNTSQCPKNHTFLHQPSHILTFHPRRSKNRPKTLTFLPSPAQLLSQLTHPIHRSKLICHQITHINNRTMTLKSHIIRNHNMIIKIMTNSTTIIITIRNNSNDRRHHRHRINTKN